jgi:hypothetical protein
MSLRPTPPVDVNGLFLSRTSVSITVDNVPYLLFKSVHWNAKLTPGETWGNRATKRGRGRGKFEPAGDMELYTEDYDQLVKQLSLKNPTRGWMLNSFTLTITASEQEKGTTTWQLIGCRVVEDDITVGDGDDQLSNKLTLNVMNIARDNILYVTEATGV